MLEGIAVSDYCVLLVSIILLIFSILFSLKRNINLGIPSIGCAFFLGIVLLKIPVNTLLGYVPMNVIFVTVVGGMFFGYAIQNGTIKNLTHQFLYRCGNYTGFVPWTIFLATALISGTGAGPTPALVIVAPIGIAAALEAGFSPILTTMAIVFGAQAGSSAIWTSSSGMRAGYLLEIWNNQTVSRIMNVLMLTGPAMFTAMFLMGYILLKGWRSSCMTFQKAEPLTKKQKETLIVLISGIALILVPAVVESFAPNPITGFLSERFNIYTFLSIGIVICSLLKLGDEREILKNQIPWSMVFMFIGVNILIGIATDSGVADMLSRLLINDVPVWLVPGVLGFIGAVLSLFSGFTVVYPLLLPLIPTLIEAGVNPISMITAVIFTTGVTAMSPFSMAGSLVLSNVKEDKLRNSLIPKQLVYTLFMGLAASIYCCTPLCSMFMFTW